MAASSARCSGRHAVRRARLVHQYAARQVQGPPCARGAHQRLRFRMDQQEHHVRVLGRTHSVFQNSPMMAKGPPSPPSSPCSSRFAARCRMRCSASPMCRRSSDGSGQDRARLRKASQLLNEAGVPVKDGKRVLPTGERFTLEFLFEEQTFAPHHQTYAKNLGVIGIEASLRIVDAVQYRKRVDDFDFDITVNRIGLLLDAGRLAAHLLHLARRRDQRHAEPCRHRRSGDRHAGRPDHRRQDARGTRDGMQGARPRDPRRPLLDSALVQSVALDRLLGRVRFPQGTAALFPWHPGDWWAL